MVYNPSTPQATDLPYDSQAEILENFTQLNTIFDVDHVTFNAVENNGKHNQTTFIDSAADPGPGADEIALYSKDLGGVSTLYMQKESGGTVIQMSSEDPVLGIPGQTFIPGGVILKWGTNAIISGAGGTTINFASAFPNNCWIVLLTALDPNHQEVTVISRNINQFVARAGNPITVQWLAIGN